MGAATIDTNTRSCPPVDGKAGTLSFPTVYVVPIDVALGLTYRK